jgi:hypothetical protein
MTDAVLLEFYSLSQKVKDFLAVAGNSLAGMRALDCAKIFPKLGPTHTNGKPKYKGMLIGCMDPDGNYYFVQAGELADRQLSEKILMNKLTVVHENSIIKSMESRELSEMIFSGASCGAGELSGWVFGVTGWPETVDDDLVNTILMEVEIISHLDYQIRNSPNQAGLEDALKSVGITTKELDEVAGEICNIVKISYELTFSGD